MQQAPYWANYMKQIVFDIQHTHQMHLHFAKLYNLFIVWSIPHVLDDLITGLFLGLHPANERWCYFVMVSLIGRVQT